MVLQIDRKANAEQSGLIEASLTKSCRTNEPKCKLWNNRDFGIALESERKARSRIIAGMADSSI